MISGVTLRGRPSSTPRSFKAVKEFLVRSEIRERSYCATTDNSVRNISAAIPVPVLMPSGMLTNREPAPLIFSTMVSRFDVERPRRSVRQIETTSASSCDEGRQIAFRRRYLCDQAGRHVPANTSICTLIPLCCSAVDVRTYPNFFPMVASICMLGDLPLNFPPAATGGRLVFPPVGAG